ncbi:NADP-dependent oxidoreductase [Pseudonocardia acidicola]|uniref:NADP-dependent oxidoreductase n=1 Tax=Pseudonocardia acidicola TaxID=2724939 RepID=A0ABX1SKY7_9PSEU|nr:NADP-dependent oxidoreductase [Pseudonocardia acidicola]NMI01203.1 NADP-dependent oxidoreductase [Pseudonocardia acidicola]
MRAVALTEYGPPEVLSVRELPDPPVGPDVVLVRGTAAGVNPVDHLIRQGLLRSAYPHHEPLVPGFDVAGTVEQAGPAATGFAPGDPVLGYVRRDDVQYGTYAELVPAPLRTLAHRPPELDATRAAGLPLAGLTALQTLQATGTHEGDTVLVYAAAGGVGHLAVQIARELGAARVLGTASERNHDFVRSLGAEPVSYGPGLVERVAALVGGDGRVDVVADFVGGDELRAAPGLLRESARHASVVDPDVRAQGGRYVWVQPDPEQLAWLAGRAAQGRLVIEVQQTFPLQQAPQAQALLEGRHVRGKLVLLV